MIIIWSLLIMLLVLLCLMFLRTLLLKPTSAKTIKIELQNNSRSIEYGKRLSKMIQKETISHTQETDRTKFYEFHKTLEELFPKVHQNCEKKVFNGSLLFRWRGKGEKAPILFMSHQDVVEATGVWEHEPFSGDIDSEGRIWGRGTVDTKGSLFCIFTALEEMIAEGYEPDGDIYIASSCTEEWNGEGAPLTVQYLKEQGVRLSLLIDEGGMIIEEPIAGVKGIYGMVGVVEKGCGDVRFIANGKGGHASAPKKNTPLVRLGKFMASVEKKNPFTSKFTPTVREMFKRIAPNMSFGMRFVFANMKIFEPLLLKVLPLISPEGGAMLHTTLAFTMAKGSDGFNVLPQEAYVIGNMRFIHHQPNAESLKLITKYAEKYQIKTEILHQEEPCPVEDYHSKEFKMVEETVKEVYPGIDVCPYVMTGATDAKYYKEISEHIIRFAPLYINNQQYHSVHGINENIYQGTLPMGVDFYKKIIKKHKKG